MYFQGCPNLLAQLFKGVHEEFFVLGKIPCMSKAIKYVEVVLVRHAIDGIGKVQLVVKHLEKSPL